MTPLKCEESSVRNINWIIMSAAAFMPPLKTHSEELPLSKQTLSIDIVWSLGSVNSSNGLKVRVDNSTTTLVAKTFWQPLTHFQINVWFLDDFVAKEVRKASLQSWSPTLVKDFWPKAYNSKVGKYKTKSRRRRRVATLVFTHPNGPNVRPLPVRPFVGCPIRLSVRPSVLRRRSGWCSFSSAGGHHCRTNTTRLAHI